MRYLLRSALALALLSVPAYAQITPGTDLGTLAGLDANNRFNKTVTGLFSGGGPSAAFLASSANPAYGWRATGQPADQKIWDSIAIGTALQFRAVNDANSSASAWMTVTRGAGATVSSVAIPNLARGAQVYGASGSAQTTTGTISATSQTLTLSSAIDFKNGNGIYIFGAGAATSVGSPTLSAVAPVNGTGSTTYAYKIASRSNNGGMKAATAAVTISNGQATLGAYQSGVSGIVMNQITWANGSGSPLCTAVWRSKSGGAYQLLGCFTGTGIFDSGLPTQTLLGIPATPPASDIADALITSIVSGAGTTSVSLADAAGSAASGQAVFHDDTAAIVAAAAVNTALYFPCGTYRVHGWSIPSTVRSIQGDGFSCSIISGLAQTTDGFKSAVATSQNASQFYMRGLRIEAALPMAFEAFTLHFAYTAGVYENAFEGATGLHVVFGKDIIAQGNHITGWWNIGIYDQTNDGMLGRGNVIHPISGQAGAVALGATPAGSDYVWGSGYVTAGGTAGIHHVDANDITLMGGAFGVAGQSANTFITNNAIRNTGRECIVPGSILTSKPKVFGNRCEWALAGNGNLSSYDLGISISDDGTHPITDFVIGGNTIINSGFAAIAPFGAAGGTLSGAVTGNAIFGSNQILDVHNCGIELSGSSTKNVTVANNAFGDVTANMTYKVCEQDNGSGLPSNTFASLNIGPAGSSGDLNLVGSGNVGLLLPVHSGQLMTLAGVETLTNKSISGASNTITNVPISTGISGLAAGIATWATTPSSANLAAAITDETGTGGVAVFNNGPTINSPTITTPGILGQASFSDSAIYTNIAAPSSPASGKVTVWTDSTDLRMHDKNASGVIGTTVVADTGAANNYISAISAAGAITKSRPACATLSDAGVFCSGTSAANLTGTLQAAQEPAHTGDVTNSAGSLALTIANNAVTFAKMATQATNTVVGNATSGTAVPTALAVGSCDTATKALQWTTNTGFVCNTAITATTNANLTGDVTSVGNATTLTNAPVIAKVLTGFASGAGTVSASDSILSAFQKINGNDALKLPLAGGTMSGAIAMGGNNITGGGTGSFTSITNPLYIGGSAASSTLTLESTSGTGTSDSIIFKTGSQVTRHTIDTNGNVSFGANAPISTILLDANKNTSNVLGGPGVAAVLRVSEVDGTDTILQMNSTGAAAGNNFAGAYAGGTLASPSAAASGKVMHNITGYAYGTSSYHLSAAIQVATAETQSNTAWGSKITFFTVPLTTASIAAALTIQPSGGVSVGTASDPGLGMIYTNSASFMSRTKTSWSTGAGAGAGTITNAPSAGNPTKWIPVDDNGTTRYIPAW